MVVLAGMYDEAGTDCIQIVGGTFRLRGVPNARQHAALVKVLRLSTFFYLSLLLEQHLLSNSHVELHFPQPTIPSVMTSPQDEQSLRQRKRESNLAAAGGLWSFFSKKTENLVHRVAAVGPSMVRQGSLELPLTRSLSTRGPLDDYAPRPRRFSFVSTSHSSGHRNTSDRPRQKPFLDALRNIEAGKDLVSTTPGLVLPVPGILQRLTEKEREDPLRRLNGEDKASLASLLGWEGKDAAGRGMVGTSGFVRQQGISLLYSAHVPLPLVASTQPTPLGSAPTASVITVPHRCTSCGNRRKWTTYRYYQRGNFPDQSLGETIIRLCATAEEPCAEPGCQFLRGDHDLQWIHSGVRIVATIGLPSTLYDPHGEDDAISMWQRCAVCGKETSRHHAHDGS